MKHKYLLLYDIVVDRSSLSHIDIMMFLFAHKHVNE